MDIVDVKKWMLDLWEKGRRRGRETARAAIIAESQGILRESARNRKELGRLAKDGNRKEKVKVDTMDQEARVLRKAERRREKPAMAATAPCGRGRGAGRHRARAQRPTRPGGTAAVGQARTQP